jgi:D-alanyl-D-alanine carboxypeptidase
MQRLVRSVAIASVSILLLTGAAPKMGTHDDQNKNPRSPYVVVNKHHPLNPKTYVPSDLVKPKVRVATSANLLRKVPASHLADMFSAYHRSTGNFMAVQSAYRSYATQKAIYNRYVSEHGQAWADRGSARPGFSEHQSGLALDIATSPGRCTLQECFANTSQGKWLAANAYKYGFILRYPKGKESTTCYKFEPWHYRYVGVDVATSMHTHKVATLEQYFAYGTAPDYR